MPDGYAQKHLLNCLWLARSMPYPLTAGDRIYSAKLAAALADAGANVVFSGLSADGSPEPVPGVAWHIVPGGQRSQLSALLSTRPLVTARHATPAYRSHADILLRSHRWDAILIDHYGSGWLRRPVMSAANRPVRVFIAHNHEASVTGSQWRESARSMPGKAYLWQNWLKTTWLEKSVARASDLITAITDTDAEQFARDAPGVRTIQLTPGYDGKRLESRTITAATPRSIILFGSYLWSAKRASLTLFLDQADSVMAQVGITIDVVGDMDQKCGGVLRPSIAQSGSMALWKMRRLTSHRRGWLFWLNRWAGASSSSFLSISLIAFRLRRSRHAHVAFRSLCVRTCCWTITFRLC